MEFLVKITDKNIGVIKDLISAEISYINRDDTDPEEKQKFEDLTSAYEAITGGDMHNEVRKERG